MKQQHLTNPAKILWLAAGVLLLTVIVFNSAIRDFAWKPQTIQADFSENASAVLGPDNYTNAADWSILASVGSTEVTSMVYDAEGETLYAAGEDAVTGVSIVRLCFNEDSLTPCGDFGVWIPSYETGGAFLVNSIVLDTTNSNRVLYAGAGDGQILRCDIDATGCTASTSWASVIDLTGSVTALVQNDTLIIAATLVESSTFINVCALSTGCDDAGDWADEAFLGTLEAVEAMVWDDAAYFYAGYAVGLVRCPSSSGCGDDADWEIVADLPFTDATYSMTMDTENDVIYVGTASVLSRCSVVSGCGDGLNWAIVFEPTQATTALLWDPVSDAVYAGMEGTGVLYKCEISASGCEIDGDWQRAVYTGGEVYVGAFARDAVTNTLYAAGFGVDSLSYSCDLTEGCNNVSELAIPELQDSSPSGVAYDAVGQQLYVADAGASIVAVYNLSTITNGEYSVSALGQVDRNDELGCNHGAGEGAPPDETMLCYPYGLAYDGVNGRLFVADSGNHRVLVYDVSDGVTDGESAINVIGQTDFVTGTTNLDQIHLNVPLGVAYDSTTERLFVADSLHNRVMVFDVDPDVLIANTPATDGPLAINEIGQTDSDETFTVYDTAGGSGADNGLDGPVAVAVNETDQVLFVADQNNNRVTVYDIDVSVFTSDPDPVNETSGPDAIHEYGRIGFNNPDLLTCDQLGSLAGCFSAPTDVDYDPVEDRLLVADTGHNRVLAFDASTIVDGDDAVEVWGQPDFVTFDPLTTQDGLSSPTAVDAGGSMLFVADTENTRIMIFGAAATPTPTPSGGRRTFIPPDTVGFFPDRIVINSDDSSTDTKNVLVNIYAHYSTDFTGTVDVLLSNTSDFATVIPFRYMVPALNAEDGWPKTIAWDLCFGLPENVPCDPGRKTVYARFYVNLPSIWPALTPLTGPNQAF